MPTVAELAQQELSRRYSLQGRTQVAPRVQTMQNARPTVRSALSNLMRDAVDATGLEGGYRQGLLNAAGGVETAVDFLPVVGDVLGLEDASRAYGQGDMVGAGINMMGVVPVVGDVAAKGAKTARSALRNVIPVGHASPHRFEQFSMDKIGTGEGAQVFGHGLYFAENPRVVDEYFQTFNAPVLRFKERNVDTPYTAEIRDRFKDVYEGLIDYDAAREWKENLLDRAYEAGLNEDEIDDNLNVLFKKVFDGTATPLDFAAIDFDKLGIDPNDIYDIADQQLTLDNVLGGISQAKSMDELEYVLEGFAPQEMRLYKDLVEPELAEISDSASRYDVNLNVEPDELLDWDRPLQEQPKAFNAIKQLYLDEIKRIDENLPSESVKLSEVYQTVDDVSMEDLGLFDKSKGGQAYRTLAESNLGRGAEELSRKLKDKGIKGIKYFDGMSRSSETGTRNYVMFDDSLIDTKRVNDQLAPSWMNPEARMQRAQDLGFDTDNVFYHGTASDFAELQPSTVGDLGGGVYVTPNPEKASGYAAVRKFMKRQTNNAGPNVLPLRVKSNLNYLDLEGSSIMPFDEARIQSLKDQGYEGIRQFDADGNVIQMNVFDPKNIRSTNAEFDPTKADSADLLSSVGATSALRGIV